MEEVRNSKKKENYILEINQNPLELASHDKGNPKSTGNGSDVGSLLTTFYGLLAWNGYTFQLLVIR